MTVSIAENNPFSPQLLDSVSGKAGIYIMKDASGEVLYVGKARDLKKRLASYARHSGRAASKTGALLSKVALVETMLTGTEKEALLLESSLIKKHRPRYNVILRDDKSYPMIKVTVSEKFPRLIVTRRRLRDGARYFGPYTSSSSMWETIRLLNSLFPLRRCKERDLKKLDRACLDFQMQRCFAPCVGSISSEMYREMVEKVLLVLEGKISQLVTEMEREMLDAATGLDFEKAALLRDRIRSLQTTVQKQAVSDGNQGDSDVFALVRHEEHATVNLLQVRDGMVTGQRLFVIENRLDDDAIVLGEVLKRFYIDGGEFVPTEILVPFPVEDAEGMTDLFREIKKGPVRIRSPRQGRGRDLVSMAVTNARQHFERREEDFARWNTLSLSLADSCGLRLVPSRVECLDISNIGGEQAVGSLVCFINGVKEKGAYRHFKVRVEGPDDFAMIAECVRRHLGRGKEEGVLPDLLVVDGGMGQVSAAWKVINELGLADGVDLLGIAKGKEGAADSIFQPGSSISIALDPRAPELLFLMKIRDEAHRFGISLHRRLRQRHSFSSPLDAVPGIGKVRKQRLLTFFGSLRRIQEASVDELAGVPGIGREQAQRIWDSLH